MDKRTMLAADVSAHPLPSLILLAATGYRASDLGNGHELVFVISQTCVNMINIGSKI